MIILYYFQGTHYQVCGYKTEDGVQTVFEQDGPSTRVKQAIINLYSTVQDDAQRSKAQSIQTLQQTQGITDLDAVEIVERTPKDQTGVRNVNLMLKMIYFCKLMREHPQVGHRTIQNLFMYGTSVNWDLQEVPTAITRFNKSYQICLQYPFTKDEVDNKLNQKNWDTDSAIQSLLQEQNTRQGLIEKGLTQGQARAAVIRGDQSFIAATLQRQVPDEIMEIEPNQSQPVPIEASEPQSQNQPTAATTYSGSNQVQEGGMTVRRSARRTSNNSKSSGM